MIGVIYKITCRKNGKTYIGQTIQNVKERWYCHCRKPYSKYEGDMHIKRAILKYGKDNFDFEVIEECDEEILDIREIYYIAFYDSYKNGYNSTPGGKECGRCLVTSKEEQDEMISLYNYGFSFREIANEYHIDKATVKGVLTRHGVKLRKTRTYKFSSEIRQQIVNAVSNGTPRKEILRQYHMSKAYLSQLLSGNRRI